MKDFKEKWIEIVDRKKTGVVAGCDPLVKVGDRFVVRDGKSIKEWCREYIENVGPNVAGIKCNPSDFQSIEGMEAIAEISKYCRENKIISILDYKISDVGHTNEKYVFATRELGFDCVTIAPYAGNADELINFCRQYELGVCNMGLMSNPEFLNEATYINPSTNSELWLDRLEESIRSGADCVVLGGTYDKENLYFKEFLQRVKKENLLFLVPGLGTRGQGGNIRNFLEALIKNDIDPRRAQLNFGRELMDSESEGEKAQELGEIFREYMEKFEENERAKQIQRPMDR